MTDQYPPIGAGPDHVSFPSIKCAESVHAARTRSEESRPATKSVRVVQVLAWHVPLSRLCADVEKL